MMGDPQRKSEVHGGGEQATGQSKGSGGLTTAVPGRELWDCEPAPSRPLSVPPD